MFWDQDQSIISLTSGIKKKPNLVLVQTFKNNYWRNKKKSRPNKMFLVVSHAIIIETVQVATPLVQEFSLSPAHWLLPLVVDGGGVTLGLLCWGDRFKEGEQELILFVHVSL